MLKFWMSYTKNLLVSFLRCLQEYDAVRQFVETFPDLDPENIPRFPDCDSAGLYVTRRCDRTNSNECFCVLAETGEKLRGSDFGGSNSAFELDCDQCKSCCILKFSFQI